MGMWASAKGDGGTEVAPGFSGEGPPLATAEVLRRSDGKGYKQTLVL
jgi:hypothetical protein